MVDVPTIVVLRQSAHGISPVRYVEAIRSRVPDAKVRFPSSREALRTAAADAEVITGEDIDGSLLGVADELQLFAATSAGTDHLPMEAFADRGVAVTNASGVHGPPVAEHVIGWMLMFARRHHVGLRRQTRREWRRYQSFGELTDATVTVVGLGAIGSAVLERLQGFGARTVGVRHSPEKGGPADDVIGYEQGPIHDALAETTYLVLTCPLTQTTRGLVDAAALRTLPTDAVVVNVARGPIVDTDALIAALRANDLEGAALDVTDPEPLPADHPLWGFDNVLITPHAAGHTPAYFERCADILAENLQTVAETGEYRHLRNQIRLS